MTYGTIPSNDEMLLKSTNEPPEIISLVRHINRIFGRSSILLLLMTRIDLGRVPRVGEVRQKVVESRIEEFGTHLKHLRKVARLRHITETVGKRSLKLVRQVKDLPLSVLTLEITRNADGTESVRHKEFSPVSIILEVDPYATLSMFMDDPFTSTESKLTTFLGESRRLYDVQKIALELDARMEYWKETDRVAKTR